MTSIHPPYRAAALAILAILSVACGENTAEPEHPNRPPMVAAELPDQLMAADDTARLDAAAYFTDPDGDALTYSVLAQDPSIVTIYVFGAEISIFSKNRGRPWVSATTITVTATDPAGLFVAQEMSVTAEAGDVGFRDEFESPTLSTWHLTNASAGVDSGTLRLTNAAPGAGKAKRRLKAWMTDWEIRTPLTLAQDSTTVRIVATTGQSPVQAFALDLGPGVLVDGTPTNYRLLLLHTGVWGVIGAGTYAPFNQAGTVLDVAFFVKDGRIGFAVDGSTIRTEADVNYGMASVELWVVPVHRATNRKAVAVFESVEVSGTVP